ncbi:hypothetical protein Tco_1215057 [Tanacetum coccineum]
MGDGGSVVTDKGGISTFEVTGTSTREVNSVFRLRMELIPVFRLGLSMFEMKPDGTEELCFGGVFDVSDSTCIFLTLAFVFKGTTPEITFIVVNMKTSMCISANLPVNLKYELILSHEEVTMTLVKRGYNISILFLTFLDLYLINKSSHRRRFSAFVITVHWNFIESKAIVDHNLWDIIVNGDFQEEPAPTRDQSGTSAPPVPKTAKQLATKRNQEDQVGGNKESKKMQKNVLKHQFENFTTAPNESMDKAYDRFQKLLSQLEYKEPGLILMITITTLGSMKIEITRSFKFQIKFSELGFSVL